MKHLEPNDPRFTAKALGEEETQPINPAANDEFASLQTFADHLKAELKAQDDKEALTEEQKERVRTAIQPKEKKILRFPMWINAAAACLVLGLLGILSFKVLDKSRSALLSEVPLSSNLPVAIHVAPSGEDKVESPVEGQLSNAMDGRSNPPAQSRKQTQTLSLDQIERLETRRNRNTPEEEAIFELSPFTIEDDPNSGYAPTTSLAGSRVNTELKDVGGSIKIVTEEFLNDTATTDGDDELNFTQKKELGSAQGNMTQPTAKILSFEEFLKTPNSLPVQKQSNRKPDVTTWSVVGISGSAITQEMDASRITKPQLLPKREPWNREAYDRIVENTFKNPTDHPLSTFSIDVDTASYANVRRFLNNGGLPPPDAVRIEEMVNYFSYDLAGPKDETPFAVHVDSANAPWNEDHRLVRIALQGKKIDRSERPDANLVFLIDVSGSMSNQNKLPLVQRSMNLLVDQMEASDRIAVVVYAGASGLALPSTTANNKETIQHAISNLKSGGSTNGGAGIELAYSVAQKHFIKGGINRVILCTDGDFNVGTSNRGGLTRLIEEKAKTGVFFSVLGFGMGNYQDATMEELSNNGNGNYGYVDSFKEARKVFVDDMLGTLYTIAKDVKIQVEFNPTHVGSYRLIGYENRMLAKEDFNDDTKDAGEIGAGHRVTAFYEIVPTGLAESKTSSVDALKYQTASKSAVKSAELLTVKLRYKQPDEDVSQLIERPFIDAGSEMDAASADFRFATAVAAFGMLLRDSELIADMSLEDVLAIATKAKGNDSGGLRSEFIELVEKAIALTPIQEEDTAASSEPRD